MSSFLHWHGDSSLHNSWLTEPFSIWRETSVSIFITPSPMTIPSGFSLPHKVCPNFPVHSFCGEIGSKPFLYTDRRMKSLCGSFNFKFVLKSGSPFRECISYIFNICRSGRQAGRRIINYLSIRCTL